MNNLTVFEFESKKVRTVIINGKPFFCLPDVCSILAIGNPSDVQKRMKPDGVDSIEVIDSLNRQQVTTFINQGNLYKAIMKSRKPEAERFQDWVTEEVLPAIMETGSYTVAPRSNEDILADAHIIAMRVIEERNQVIAELKPKAEYFDAAMSSDDAIHMDKVAKILNMGVGGRNKLFLFLRAHGILKSNNDPYQQYMDAGYFKLVERIINVAPDKTKIKTTTFVYQKGIDFIRKQLLKAGEHYLNLSNMQSEGSILN